jgi:hypothetical protein
MQLDFVAGVVDAAARADLDVLLSPSGGDHDRSFEWLPSEGRADGVILMEIPMEDPRVGRLQDAGLPFVGIGHTAGDQQMSWATSTTPAWSSTACDTSPIWGTAEWLWSLVPRNSSRPVTARRAGPETVSRPP